jgi:hypothetical protein
MREKIESLLQQMTLTEKVSLLAGASKLPISHRM